MNKIRSNATNLEGPNGHWPGEVNSSIHAVLDKESK